MMASRADWHGMVGQRATQSTASMSYAWLIEDLSEGRVRILTQESQKGKPAAELYKDPKDPMNVGHQEWVRGLAATVLAAHQG